MKEQSRPEEVAMVEGETFEKQIEVRALMAAQNLARSLQHATKHEPKREQSSALIKQVLRN